MSNIEIIFGIAYGLFVLSVGIFGLYIYLHKKKLTLRELLIKLTKWLEEN